MKLNYIIILLIQSTILWNCIISSEKDNSSYKLSLLTEGEKTKIKKIKSYPYIYEPESPQQIIKAKAKKNIERELQRSASK